LEEKEGFHVNKAYGGGLGFSGFGSVADPPKKGV
jgi:hypothetical protein